MAKKNKVCLTCGTNYTYCSNCNKKDPTWMAEFHSEECKIIFDTCTRYNMQLISKEEARMILEKYDLSNKENFKPYIQRDLKNIFTKDEIEEKKNIPENVPSETAPIFRNKPKNKPYEVVNKTK